MATVQIPSSSVPAPTGIEFTKLNPYVSIYTPPPASAPPHSSSHTPQSSPPDPAIILICQWMGASPRSRALQTLYQRYAALYPAAQIVSLRSVAAFFISTGTGTRLGYVEPVVDVLKSVLVGESGSPGGGSGEVGEGTGTRKGRVLVHVFSNGGGLMLWDVCNLWKMRRGQEGNLKVHANGTDGRAGGVLDIQAIVLDSTPGDPSVREGWEAMKVGLPKGLLWWFGAASVWTLMGCLWIWKTVMGRQTLVDQMRRGMNDGTVVDRHAKRLYVYSKADRLVDFRGIERHIEEARGLGVEVMTLREEETPHVQHMIKDEERYWSQVEELWRSTRV